MSQDKGQKTSATEVIAHIISELKKEEIPVRAADVTIDIDEKGFVSQTATGIILRVVVH